MARTTPRVIDQGHVKLLGERRRGETFVVGCHDLVDFLSHGTVLEDCRIEIRGAGRNFVFHGATFRDCTIVTKRELRNESWHEVAFERCAFVGRFTGNDFGARREEYPDPPFGSVIECDFSEARLHLCRFFDCDVAKITLPKWPSLPLVGARWRDAWRSLSLPASMRIAQEIAADVTPGQAAFLIDVETWCRESEVPLDAVRALLEPFSRPDAQESGPE